MAVTGAPGVEEDLQRPIHRIHRSNVPLKPDKTDPYGWQARGALVRYAPCPFLQIKEGDPDLKTALDEISDWVKEGQDRDASRHGRWAEEFEEFIAHKDRPEAVELKQAKQTKPQSMKQLVALSMIYRRLSGEEMASVRKASIYPRRLSWEALRDKGFETDKWTQLWYVVFPMMLFFFCFSFQSFMLHIATALYVRYMERIDNVLPERTNLADVEGGELFDLVARTVALAAAHGNETEASEEAVRNGNVRIPMSILDLSGAIPAALCTSAFLFSYYKGRFHVGLWYKTYLIACCMAVMKGILDVVTILPDSIGWKQCKERLGPEAFEKMKDRHFFTDFWGSMSQAVVDEVIGVDGKRIRYCADMMLSGHTYFAALFSLAAYKLTGAIDMPAKVQRLVGVVCCICVVVEVVMVAAARFHYTVDMITSVFLVCLLWDSLYIEQTASDWSEGYSWRDPEKFTPRTLCCCRKRQPRTSRKASASGKEMADPALLPGVLPSQSTHLINMRMLEGRAPWEVEAYGCFGLSDDADGQASAGETCPLMCQA